MSLHPASTYWTFGQAGSPWLVICHGAGLDHREFLPAAEQLAREWRVLLWDLPGHGANQPMPSPFTVDACAERLAAVMDEIGVQRAVFVGFSFGGMVAQVFAKRWPGRVAGFIAYGCFTPHLLPPLAPAEAVSSVVKAQYADRPLDEIRTEFAERCCLTEAGRTAVLAAMTPLGKAGFLTVVEALLAASDYDPGFRINAPVALLWGALDSNGAALEAAMAAYRSAYADPPEQVIAGASHCAHLDHPAEFLAALATLLQTMC